MGEKEKSEKFIKAYVVRILSDKESALKKRIKNEKELYYTRCTACFRGTRMHRRCCECKINNLCAWQLRKDLMGY